VNTRERTTAVDALTEEELDGLLGTFTDTPTGKRNRALVLVMADAGLRVSEALGLETRDLLREAGQITHLAIRHGKGGKAAKQRVTTRTAAALAKWGEARAALGIGEGPMFCTVTTGAATGRSREGQRLVPGDRIATAYVREFVKKAGVKAALRMDVHPHLLRHTAITRYLRANKDLELTRKFARHADITTTARVYSHLVQEDVDRGVERLPGNGAPAPTVPDLAAALAALTPEQKAALVAALTAGGDA
jgi:site-specific recombinase XerC